MQWCGSICKQNHFLYQSLNFPQHLIRLLSYLLLHHSVSTSTVGKLLAGVQSRADWNNLQVYVKHADKLKLSSLQLLTDT